MKENLLILFGGANKEHDVSLQSAYAVIKVVDQSKYNLFAVGITKEGQWLLFEGKPEQIKNNTWWQQDGTPVLLSPCRENRGIWLLKESGVQQIIIDKALPIIHGINGEDGSLQGVLQLAGIPLAGCGVAASALCMDKAIANRLATGAGINCAKQNTFYGDEKTIEQLTEEVTTAMKAVNMPWFIKPAREGSSFGIKCATHLSQLPEALQGVLFYGNKFVVEEAIDGNEVGCAIIGSKTLFASVPDMIHLEDSFFDYHEKYNLETAKIVLPAPVSDAKQQEIQALAKKLYRLFSCSGFARVDLFLKQDGTLFFNEINTIPGFTPQSRYPRMMEQSGVGFEELVQNIIDEAGVAF